MLSQVAPCVRQIGSSISSVFVDSVLYELDVELRDEVIPLSGFVGEVDDDKPCAYRNKLGEETFHDLFGLNQRSSHSKGDVDKTHKDPLPTLQMTNTVHLYQSVCQNI
jgi:hypothetical protein